VLDRIERDVDDVVIGDGVGDLTTPAPSGQDAGLAQDLEVLGDQRLACLEGVGEVVNTALAVLDLEDDGQPERMGEGLEQLGCGFDTPPLFFGLRVNRLRHIVIF
jgi:hypothetical protein